MRDDLQNWNANTASFSFWAKSNATVITGAGIRVFLVFGCNQISNWKDSPNWVLFGLLLLACNTEFFIEPVRLLLEAARNPHRTRETAAQIVLPIKLRSLNRRLKDRSWAYSLSCYSTQVKYLVRINYIWHPKTLWSWTNKYLLCVVGQWTLHGTGNEYLCKHSSDTVGSCCWLSR